MVGWLLIVDLGVGSENGNAAKTPPRRTLQSQLSRCEDEDGEKARVSVDAMSPVQVSKPVRLWREFLRAFPF